MPARPKRSLEDLQRLFGVLMEKDADGKLILPPPKVGDVLISASRFGSPTGHGKPVRMRKGCPTIRDAEHARKHKLRKISHASRKANQK